MVERDGDMARLDGVVREKRELTCGARGQRERRGEAMRSESANQKGKCISMRAPMAYGPDGLAGQSGYLRGRVGWISELGRLGRTLGRIQKEVDFRISIEFRFWQDFRKLYKEI
jgi:hypothetical protein